MKSQRFFWIFCLLVLFVGYSCKKTPSDPGDDNNGNTNGEQEIVYGDTATANVKMPQFDIPWPSLADSPWPMSTVNPQGIARCSYPGPSLGVVIWSLDVGYGKSRYGPAIGVDGTIYYSRKTGFVALTSQGEIKWAITDEDLYPRVPVVVAADSTIYAAGRGLFAYNPDGTLKWKALSGRYFARDSHRPLVGIDGTIYVKEYNDGDIYAIAPDSTILWQNRIGRASGYIVASPDGLTIYAPGSDGSNYTLVAMDALSGSVAWALCSTILFYSAPAIDNQGNIYFAGRDDEGNATLFSYYPTGSLRWEYRTERKGTLCISGITIDYNGYIYLTWNGFGLFAIDYEGQLRWILRPYQINSNSPIICDVDNNLTIQWDSEIKLLNYRPDGTKNWEIEDIGFNTSQLHPGAISYGNVLIFGSNTPWIGMIQ